MSGKNINWQQKNQESNFYKNKEVKKIDDIDISKVLVSKEEPYGTKVHLNTSLDTMIMMLSCHYA